MTSNTPPSGSPPPSFAETLAAAKAGDRDATERLFEQFYANVRHTVHHSLATDLRNSRPWLTARFSTGDVVQDVFRSVLGDLAAFGGTNERAFAGYLSMVVRNRIIDSIRFHEAERRDGRLGADLAAASLHPSDEVGPDQYAESTEAFEALQEALNEFPEREQLLLRARFDGTGTFEDLREQLGYSSAAAARRAFFAAQATLAMKLKKAQDTGGEER